MGLASLATGAALAQQADDRLTYPDGSPHPVTAWGDPDLQGMWPIMHLFSTPLQRPEQFGDRRFRTEEEIARAQASLDRREANYRGEIDSGRMGMGHWAETTQSVHEDDTAVRNFIETSRFERGLTAAGEPLEE